MENRENEKEQMIIKLQNMAEQVLELKTQRSLRRPIIIEFSGSPKAGKTSCINSLVIFLKRNGFKVKVVQERASMCPVSDKLSPMFNLWTANMSLSAMIGILEDKTNEYDVIILDRGIFDALCWFEFLVNKKKMEPRERELVREFLLMDSLVRLIDIVFVFKVEPEQSIEREYAPLLTTKEGSIMNSKILREYLDATNNTIVTNQKCFHSIQEIDTTSKPQHEVSKEVTELTLNILKNLLMERVGFIKKEQWLVEKFKQQNSILTYEDICNNYFDMHFDLREKVEDRVEYIQPIPIAVITNKERNKILVVEKNNQHLSAQSPEKGKFLLYIGGHTREEDVQDKEKVDFIKLCRSTLVREIKEEIGNRVAIEEIEPFLIYSTDSTKSKQHMAVCFLYEVDTDNFKVKLDTTELKSASGKSKSGKFMDLGEISSRIDEFESWSRAILKKEFSAHEQINLFK